MNKICICPSRKLGVPYLTNVLFRFKLQYTNLMLSNVTKSDAGLYTCEVTHFLDHLKYGGTFLVTS